MHGHWIMQLTLMRQKLLIKEIFERTRKTLESWHTALSDQADNNSKPLPGQYTMLTKKR